MTFQIYNENRLTDLDFSSLSTINGNFIIQNNSSLTDVSTFESISWINGYAMFYNNTSLSLSLINDQLYNVITTSNISGTIYLSGNAP